MIQGSPDETPGRDEVAEAGPSGDERHPDSGTLAVFDARVARLREILASSEVRAARIVALLNEQLGPGGAQGARSARRLAG